MPSFVVLLKPRLAIYKLGKYAKGNIVFLRQFSNHLNPKEWTLGVLSECLEFSCLGCSVVGVVEDEFVVVSAEAGPSLRWEIQMEELPTLSSSLTQVVKVPDGSLSVQAKGLWTIGSVDSHLVLALVILFLI